MPSNTYNIIREAIIKKQQVTAMYSGYYREMCPHVIGTKNGTEQALFYQFGGDSSSELHPPGDLGNWRCIPLAGLSEIVARNGEWHSAQNYPGPQTCVDEIDLAVELFE